MGYYLDNNSLEDQEIKNITNLSFDKPYSDKRVFSRHYSNNNENNINLNDYLIKIIDGSTDYYGILELVRTFYFDKFPLLNEFQYEFNHSYHKNCHNLILQRPKKDDNIYTNITIVITYYYRNENLTRNQAKRIEMKVYNEIETKNPIELNIYNNQEKSRRMENIRKLNFYKEYEVLGFAHYFERILRNSFNEKDKYIVRETKLDKKNMNFYETINILHDIEYVIKLFRFYCLYRYNFESVIL